MALELDLSLDLGGFRLGVQLHSEAGSLALLGPSGAGKSMTLRAVTGTLRPAGRVVLDGRVLQDDATGTWVPPQDRGIGYVPQSYALFPHLTVADNLGFSLGRRMGAAPRVREVAEVLDLGDLLDRRPAQLSGGQQQRVAMARALVARPGTLVLDEPLAALDVGLRRRLREDLAGIRERTGVRILVASHLLSDAQVLAEEIAVLDRGEVLQHGPLEDVLQRPVSTRVAELVRATNVVPASVLSREEGWCEVSVCGQRVKVVAEGIGEAVWLVVRPEHLRLLAPDEQTVGAEWSIRGTLLEGLPRAGVWEVRVALDAEVELAVAVPAWWWRAHTPRPGEACRIAGCATAAHLLDRG